MAIAENKCVGFVTGQVLLVLPAAIIKEFENLRKILPLDRIRLTYVRFQNPRGGGGVTSTHNKRGCAILTKK